MPVALTKINRADESSRPSDGMVVVVSSSDDRNNITLFSSTTKVRRLQIEAMARYPPTGKAKKPPLYPDSEDEDEEESDKESEEDDEASEKQQKRSRKRKGSKYEHHCITTITACPLTVFSTSGYRQ